MKFRHPSCDTYAAFRVLSTPTLALTALGDLGAMVTFGTGGDDVPGLTTLEVTAASGQLRCAFRSHGTSEFVSGVRLPPKLTGSAAEPAMATFLSHVLAPVCVGACGETTYIDWDDIEYWLRANPRLLLGCGAGDSIAEAYQSAREGLDGFLDSYPSQDVFLVGYCPPDIHFPDGLRSVRAAWGDRIVLHGFPATTGGGVAISLLVADDVRPGSFGSLT